MPTTATHLSELATTHPAATRVFHRHRLDYCCGGRRSLADVCAERGLDADALLAEIVATPADPGASLADRPLPELAAHVVDRYHAPLREDLPRLAAMAAKVERVHGEKPACPLGLGAHLAEWGEEVLLHLDKEEQSLFPTLAGDAPRTEIVAALSREHDDHAAALSRTRELTGDLVPPAHACTTWRALYAGLEQVECDLMEHVHIENHILFPRALAR